MNSYKEVIGRINYGLFLVVVFILPFPQIFLRYACVIWLVFWLLEGRWLSRPKSWRENKMMIPFLLFGLWFLWEILSGLWATDRTLWAVEIERYISFGALVPVGVWGLNERYNWQQIGKVLVIGCLSALVFYPALLTTLLFHREIIDQLQWVALWDYSSSQWWYFYQSNFSIIKHRLFFCSVEIVGMIVASQLWHERRALWLSTLLLMEGGCVLTGSRQIILTMAIVAAVALIIYLPQQLRWRYGLGVLVLGIALGAGALWMQPRMQGFDLQIEYRTLAWQQVLAHPSDYLLTGLGAGQDCSYIQVEEVSHCHNQYLQVLMELGIFGLLLFLDAWISVPLCAQKKGRQTAILFTTLFACNMCTDCMFALYCGVALWSAGLLFILIQSHAASE